jgi:hypothetical protein
MTTCACGNCQFMDNEGKAAAKHRSEDAGLCRYYPPMTRQANASAGVWPVVTSKDWCGHFAAKVDRFMAAAAE